MYCYINPGDFSLNIFDLFSSFGAVLIIWCAHINFKWKLLSLYWIWLKYLKYCVEEYEIQIACLHTNCILCSRFPNKVIPVFTTLLLNIWIIFLYIDWWSRTDLLFSHWFRTRPTKRSSSATRNWKRSLLERIALASLRLLVWSVPTFWSDDLLKVENPFCKWLCWFMVLY